MRTRRRLFFASVVVTVAACGSRTGLLVPLVDEEDGGADARPDNIVHRVDAAPDVMAEEDALPPLDVRPPVDVILPSDCPDAGSTLIYVISSSNNLYSFNPPTAVFKLIGTIACPSASQPFSMGVDRRGIAYILFQDGELFRVSTATAACVPTGFASNQGGFATTFGMGFSEEPDGGESLFVASDADGGPSQLATIDVLNKYTLHLRGDFNPQITRAELTGTGAGGLFGFWETVGASSSAIVQIDKATAQVTNSSTLNGVDQGSGWAFAFWGGDFYTFTAPTQLGSTVVTRFNPNDGSIVQVAQTNDVIVGAGVSTCAPQQ